MRHFFLFPFAFFLGLAMMELRQVTKHYPQGRRIVRALQGVSLRIDAGEFVSIMGPSGSGKSTLMHLLGALDTPTSGEVYFQNKPLHAMPDGELAMLRRQRIGFIFQFFNLLPSLTAVENVALPLLLAGQGRGKAMGPARALVIEPEAVLCDEPTGNLDSKSSEEVLQLLRSIPEPGRRAVVMVTHDADAAAYGDRIVHIKDGLVASEDRVKGDTTAITRRVATGS